MIRDFEDKLFRGDAERDRRERRMEEYKARVRARFSVAPDFTPCNHVEIAHPDSCEPFRVDTSKKPE